jgi:hypothetical protein
VSIDPLRAMCEANALPIPVAARALPASGLTHAIRLDWEQGPSAVLEIVPPHPTRDAGYARRAAALARDAGLPVPKAESVSVPGVRDDATLWLGVGGASSIDALAAPTSGRAVAREIGRMLRLLGAVTLPGPGRLGDGGPVAETSSWAELVTDRARTLRAMALRGGADLGPVCDELLAVVSRAAPALGRVSRFGLVHGGLTPAVVHLGDDGEIDAVRGWEGAFSGDPLWDLAHVGYLLPHAVDGLLAGLGDAVPTLDEDVSTRLDAYFAVLALEWLADAAGAPAEESRAPRLEQARRLALAATRPGRVAASLARAPVEPDPDDTPEDELLDGLLSRLGATPRLGPEHAVAWAGAMSATLLACELGPMDAARLRAWGAHLASALPRADGSYPSLDDVRLGQVVQATSADPDPHRLRGIALAALAALASERRRGAVSGDTWAGLRRLVAAVEAGSTSPESREEAAMAAAVFGPLAVAGARALARLLPSHAEELEVRARDHARAVTAAVGGVAPLRLDADEAARLTTRDIVEPLLDCEPSVDLALVPAMILANRQLSTAAAPLVPAARLVVAAILGATHGMVAGR